MLDMWFILRGPTSGARDGGCWSLMAGNPFMTQEAAEKHLKDNGARSEVEYAIVHADRPITLGIHFVPKLKKEM